MVLGHRTYDGVTEKLYINGMLDTQRDVAPYTIDPQLAIGRRGTSAVYYFKGMIDDVQVYDYALSSNEVAALYGGAPAAGITVTPDHWLDDH